jgi:glycosyltransferase involved in cell wall biosynthesis
MNKLAVALMTKNESHVIERCLGSILSLEPDLVVITDTGSQDDTVVKAGLFLQHNKIKFQIYQEPFIDFGYNRSLLLKYTRKASEVEYTLMLDADDSIEYSPDYDALTFRNSLHLEAYEVKYHDSILSYYLPKLTSNHRDFNYLGVTHEYLNTDNTSVGQTTFITTFQHNDGSRRLNNTKHTDDIRLLERALQTDDGLRSRYLFYLAQAYRARHDNAAALQYYYERLRAGGWVEEIFYSHYQLGQIYQEMGNEYFDNCVSHYLTAYTTCRQRVESLVNLYYYLLQQNKKLWAESIWEVIRTVKRPSQGLFLEDRKYELIH